MPAAVEVVDLVKCYGPLRAVDGISFAVAAGEIVGLLGPNGAGKTSTLECLLGLRSADSGTVRIDGVGDPAIARRRVGAVLQSTALQDKITPREALRLFAGFYGVNRSIDQLLDQFELVDKADATFDSLSGGQRQRLALALAFVHQPAVLVLDEPTAGLDPGSRRNLHTHIRSMQQKGCAVLVSTHFIDEAHTLCDRVVIIDRGRVVAQGTPAELVAGISASVQVSTRPTISVDRWNAIAPARERDDGVLLQTVDVTTAVMGITRLIESSGVTLVDLRIHPPTLEEAFFKLTGSNIYSDAEPGR